MKYIARVLTSCFVFALVLTGAWSPHVLSPGRAHAQTTLSLVTPLALSPASPAVNQATTATFTVQNTGGQAVTVQTFVAGARTPANGNVDFQATAPVTLQPGQQFRYSASRSFTTSGTYTDWPAYTLDNVNWVELAPHTSFTVGNTTTPGQISLVTPLALSPASPAVNQATTATFTVQNTGGQAVTVQTFVAGARDPASANVDFGATAPVTLQPGQQFPYSATRSFTTPGTYVDWPAYTLDGVNWVELAVHTSFAVTSGGTSTGPFPCGATPCGRGQFPPASWRPYADTSAFNRPVSATARLMSNSAAIVNRMLGDISANDQPANILTPNDGTGGWPTYYGASSDPVYSITCNEFGGTCSVEGMSGHAPAGAAIQGNDPAADADRHLTFIDQTTGKEFDLWHVQISPLPAGGGLIPTGWSGYTMIDGNGLAVGTLGEGNAGRYGNLAGRVRIEELKDAIARQSFINHALTISVDCTSGTTVYPARNNAGRACGDIGKSNVDAPAMGARLHLNLPMATINAMAIPEWKKVFLRTLVVYGAIINDTGSSFYFDWQMESGNQYTSMGVADPWLAFGQSMANQANSDWNFDSFTPGGGYVGLWQRFNDGIDWTAAVWSHLEVLDACVSDGSC